MPSKKPVPATRTDHSIQDLRQQIASLRLTMSTAPQPKRSKPGATKKKNLPPPAPGRPKLAARAPGPPSSLPRAMTATHMDYTLAYMHSPRYDAPIPPPRNGQSDAQVPYVPTRGTINYTATVTAGQTLLLVLTPDGYNMASAYLHPSTATFTYPSMQSYYGTPLWDDGNLPIAFAGGGLPWVGGISPLGMILDTHNITPATASAAPLYQNMGGRADVTISASWDAIGFANSLSKGDCPSLFGNKRPQIEAPYTVDRAGTNHHYVPSACSWNLPIGASYEGTVTASTPTHSIVGGGGDSSTLMLHYPFCGGQRTWVAGGDRLGVNGRTLGLPIINNPNYDVSTGSTLLVVRNTGTSGSLLVQVRGFAAYNCQLANADITAGSGTLVDAMIERAPIAVDNPIPQTVVQHRTHHGRAVKQLETSLREHIPNHPPLTPVTVAPSSVGNSFAKGGESFGDRLKDVGVTAVEKIGGAAANALSGVVGRLISAL